MSDSINNVSSDCTLRSSKNEQRNTGNDKQMGTIKLYRNDRNNRRDRGEMHELGHNWKSQPKDCERIAGKTKTPTKKTFSASAQEKSQMSAKIADAKHMSVAPPWKGVPVTIVTIDCWTKVVIYSNIVL